MNRNFNHVNRADLDDCLERFEKNAADLVPTRVAVLRNVTVEPLVPYLRYHGYACGLDIKTYLGGYDTIMADVSDSAGLLYAFNPDVIIIVVHPGVLCPLLWYDFSCAGQSEINGDVERVTGFLRSVMTAVRKHTRATVVVNGLEVPVFPANGIADVQRKDGQVQTIRSLNARLFETCSQFSSASFVDLELLTSRFGSDHFIDQRYWHIGRNPYTALGWDALGAEYLKYLRPLKGKTKKCLVLDCDNTLWGGVVGENGISGIALDETFPGSAFVAFQRALRELHGRGVLLALCSKNNEHDVMEVLDRHPHMALRRSHFASIKINWENKASNILAIAKELQLGLDSFVFVDDSGFEIDFVRKALPSVACLELPEDPSGYRDLILSCGLFDTPVLSQEDLRRTEFYEQERLRKDSAQTHAMTDLGQYLASLELSATVCLADDFAIPRIAQLTQKTNQFNLTTRRYSEAQIRELAGAEGSEVLYLSLKDKFGDSGITGVCILTYRNERAIIDTFLLSCRVIGRGADEVLLKAALERSSLRPGIKMIQGLFHPTPKNEQVKHFYSKNGFARLDKNGDGSSFGLPVQSAPAAHYPDYYASITILGKQVVKTEQ